MAKQKKDTKLILEYNLYDLPTAQHKAGLAGLLLMVESMQKRGINPLPNIIEKTSTSVKIELKKKMIQTLFDDLYDAEIIEIERKQKRKDKDKNEIPPKRTIEKEIIKNEKSEKQTFYVYDDYQPKGKFLQALYEDPNGLWIKIWRDMIWYVLRGKPTTRNVYKERASGKRSTEVKIHNKLLEAIKQRKQGKIKIENITQALFLGAESENAEKISIQGSIENNFLLHFWPLASKIYIPYSYKFDKSKKRLEVKQAGFAIAVPEPNNLKDFIDDTIALYGELDSAVFKYDRYPSSSKISLPEEGGLEYLHQIVKKKYTETDYKFSVSSVEIHHMEKIGNNIKIHSCEKIIPNRKLIEQYEHLEGKNPIFRAHAIKNILSGKKWFEGMTNLFEVYPSEFFIKSDSTPSNISFFGRDIRRNFKQIEDKIKLQKEDLR